MNLHAGIDLKFNKHSYIILALFIILIIRIELFELRTTEAFKPDSWAEMSFAIGASILTLVGIITSIVLSNENDRRREFIDDLTFVLNKLKYKARINPDRSLSRVYENSDERFSAIIADRSPLKYSDGIIGILSFFFFLTSGIIALENLYFKWIYGTFLTGVALLVGYVVYCIFEFKKIDGFSRLPELGERNLTLFSVSINGQSIHFDAESREPVIAVYSRIRRMEFGVRLEGQVRNGFFHAVIRYRNGQSTHIPEPNTYLGDTEFADGLNLVISPNKRLDTGILQNNGPVELLFEVCKDMTENPIIREIEVSRLGRREMRQYCSIPANYAIESIELRVWEDPLYQSSHKRREVAILTVLPEYH